MGTTIFRSVSLFGVIIATALTYAFVGIVFFSQVRSGEEIDYRLVGRGGEGRGRGRGRGRGGGGKGRDVICQVKGEKKLVMHKWSLLI